MADDVTLPGTGAVIMTDDVGSGRQAQVVKAAFGADGTATMVTPDVGLPAGIASTILTGSASANNTNLIAATDASGYQMFCCTLTGTFSATVQVQGSNDNTNWYPFNLQALSDGQLPSASGQGMTSTLTMNTGVIPTKFIRVRTSSYSSGTVSAVLRLYNGSAAGILPATMPVSGSFSPNAFATFASDAASTTVWSTVGAYLAGFNGTTFSRHRVATTFKSVTATSSGNTAVWTPTSGKRVQLLRVQFFATGDAAQTTGGVMTVKLQDNASDIGVSVPVYVPTTGGTGLGGWTSGPIDIGPYGFRSSAINLALNVNLSAALTAGSIGVIAIGTEE